MGEYSNVHATLAEGLRQLGHQVTVLSNGDFWKNYPRDIDLVRKPGKWGGIAYMARLYALLPKLRGYDVVQLINPMFLELKAERILPVYRYLKRHNGKIILGGFGMDYYWVSGCCNDKPLRYSDFNMGEPLRTNADALKERKDWLGTEKERLNRIIAGECNGIVTGLYEYWACYHPKFPAKTTFIPLPIKPHDLEPVQEDSDKVRIFIGINRSRSEYKGTDIMLKAAQAIAEKISRQDGAAPGRKSALPGIRKDDERERCHPRPALQLHSLHESAGSDVQGHHLHWRWRTGKLRDSS